MSCQPGRLVATVLFDAGLALHAASLIAALVSLVLGFRASRGVERQQLRWVAARGTATLTVAAAFSPLRRL